LEVVEALEEGVALVEALGEDLGLVEVEDLENK
jgi:hypothetical protein